MQLVVYYVVFSVGVVLEDYVVYVYLLVWFDVESYVDCVFVFVQFWYWGDFGVGKVDVGQDVFDCIGSGFDGGVVECVVGFDEYQFVQCFFRQDQFVQQVYVGYFVDFVFFDVGGDVYFVFVWCDGDLGGVYVEVCVVVVYVVGLQFFQVVGEFFV